MIQTEITWQPGVTLAQLERAVIIKAFYFFNQNKTRAAEALGISYRAIRYKLDEYGVSKNDEIDGENTDSRPHMESGEKLSSEREMPMREREEVQKMPPRQIAGHSARRGR